MVSRPLQTVIWAFQILVVANAYTHIPKIHNLKYLTKASTMTNSQTQPSHISLRMAVGADGKTNTQNADLVSAKQNLLQAIKEVPKNGVGCSPEQRSEIDKKLSAVLEQNPTKVHSCSVDFVLSASLRSKLFRIPPIHYYDLLSRFLMAPGNCKSCIRLKQCFDELKR